MCILFIVCVFVLFFTRTFGAVMRAARGQAFPQRQHKTNVAESEQLALNSAEIILQRHIAKRLHTKRQQPTATPKNFHQQAPSSQQRSRARVSSLFVTFPDNVNLNHPETKCDEIINHNRMNLQPYPSKMTFSTSAFRKCSENQLSAIWDWGLYDAGRDLLNA